MGGARKIKGSGNSQPQRKMSLNATYQHKTLVSINTLKFRVFIVITKIMAMAMEEREESIITPRYLA